ncbi:GNAT family N-acetyltransferase [Anabaena sp. UHCC 0204]|uniref:GNAT family N-acetyltransferase n=1 Tax=Anabaena sp. UHCC 0204 TaxID=2590009 RepID=UPI00144530CA
MAICIYPLENTGHTRSSIKKLDFKCTDSKEEELYPELVKYIKQLAWKNNEIGGIARTFVACPEDDRKKILGYYTSSMSLIELKNLPDEVQESLPGYPVPALLIGKFAVDKLAQKQGIGKQLLKHAFETALEVSQKVGVFAVRVDAKDEQAKQYYLKKGFLSLEDKALGLYIPISTLKAAKAEQEAKQASEINLSLLSN